MILIMSLYNRFTAHTTPQYASGSQSLYPGTKFPGILDLSPSSPCRYFSSTWCLWIKYTSMLNIYNSWRNYIMMYLIILIFIVRFVKSWRLWSRHIIQETQWTYSEIWQEISWKEPFGRPNQRWKNSSKVDVKDIGFNNVDWTMLTHDKISW
jgi:hypothetical protein